MEKINDGLKEIRHEGMAMRLRCHGDTLSMERFSPLPIKNELGEATLLPFHLRVVGDDTGSHYGNVTGSSHLPFQFRLTGTKTEGASETLTYVHDALGLEVAVRFTHVPGTRVIRQENTIKNIGTNDVTLTHFSSACVMGLAADGLFPWHHKGKIRVHTCRNVWEGEGQWQKNTLEELGLYPCSVHQCMAAVDISSTGSWSTNKYYPIGMVEDTETGEIWYFQIESSSDWHIEIGHRKISDGRDGVLYIEMDSADELHGGWLKVLSPGEEYAASPAAFGCVSGGFDEAVEELTKYRRTVLKPENAWDGECPVVYNDYMNTLWGNPTDKRLIPLIDRAAYVGVQVFCIDAGWFGPVGQSWAVGIGDWEECDERFGQYGLRGIADYMRSKGLIPGIWLEMDSVQRGSKLFERPDDWFLQRSGRRVGGSRCFLNFRNAAVRDYLHGKIDHLTELGFSYIKNDYNQTTGLGALDVQENVRAFCAFIDEVRARHPRLIIENCGSGALRSDNGILSHFHLQSTSDQELFDKYPSILSGSLANILPEQAGIWSYPCPMLFLDMNKSEDYFNGTDYQSTMSDGEQTVFNMVSGMCGSLYLSGHLDYCDERNLSLVREGVELYKSEREHIRTSYPIWPSGRCAMSDNTFTSLGLLSSDKRRILLAVWRFGTSERYMNVDLSNWTKVQSAVRLLYPSGDTRVGYAFNGGNRSLSVCFDKPFTARYFEITV
ncbi:MAG: glycoside hydrolase family 36 protein [Eubacteriales bacterium]